jgi:RNA polymerase sigma-70 factor (ECF subfamily)
MISSSYASHSINVLPDENRLVRQARSGDADAFVQLYEAYVDRVYRYIYFQVTDDKLAESITPYVFIKAWQLLDRYHSYSSSFITWLYKIASNQLVEYFRTHPNSDPKTDSHANRFLWSLEDRAFDEHMKEIFDLQAMRDALQFLTEEEQQVLILKFVAGVPTNTIARMMAKPASAIPSLLMHAMQTVTRYMDEKDIK